MRRETGRNCLRYTLLSACERASPFLVTRYISVLMFICLHSMERTGKDGHMVIIRKRFKRTGLLAGIVGDTLGSFCLGILLR